MASPVNANHGFAYSASSLHRRRVVRPAARRMDDSRARGEEALAGADLREMERRIDLRDPRFEDERRGQLLHALHAGGQLRRAVGGHVRIVHAPRRKPQRPCALFAGGERTRAGRERLRAHFVAPRAAKRVVGEIAGEAHLARPGPRVLHLDKLERRRLVDGRVRATDYAQRTVGGARLGVPHAVEGNRIRNLAARLSVRRQARHLVFGEPVCERSVRVVRLHAEGRPHDLAYKRERPVARHAVREDQRHPQSAHLHPVGVRQARVARDVPHDPLPAVRDAPPRRRRRAGAPLPSGRRRAERRRHDAQCRRKRFHLRFSLSAVVCGLL